MNFSQMIISLHSTCLSTLSWYRLKNIDSESNSVTCIMTGDKFPHDHVVDGTDQIVTFGICW